MCSLVEGIAESVNGSHEPRRYRVKVAAFTCCKVHCRCKCCCRFLCLKSCPGKVKGSRCRIIHSECTVGSSLLHCIVQELCLCFRIAHSGIGKLHGLINFCKLIGRHSSQCDKGERYLCGKLLPELGHLLPCCRKFLTELCDRLSTYRAEVEGFFFKLPQFFLAKVYLRLQFPVLFRVLVDILTVKLLLCLLECVQLSLRLCYLVIQERLLVLQQVDVAGIELESLFD